MKRISFIIIILIQVFYSIGQQYSSTSKKAIKLLEEAMDAPRLNKDEFGRENYTLGLTIAKKSIEKDPNFWEAYLLAGEFAELSNQLPLAIEYYKKTIQINPKCQMYGRHKIRPMQEKLFGRANQHYCWY